MRRSRDRKLEQRANDATLTEAHVVRLLSVEDLDDWGVGLVLRKDGIYRRDWTDDELRPLSPNEVAAIGGSSRGDLLLRLPCTLDDLETFASAECLLDPFIVRRFHLLRLIAGRRAAPAAESATTMLVRRGRGVRVRQRGGAGQSRATAPHRTASAGKPK